MRMNRINGCSRLNLLAGIALMLGAISFHSESAFAQIPTTQLHTANARAFNETLEASGETRFATSAMTATESQIGPNDLLDINVFEAPEMNRTVRVSAAGEISLQLLGTVKASGLTPPELETALQGMLRKTYIKNPHVAVFVRELQSHAVSVVGAVKMPGVYQIRGTETVIELLSLAQGLSDDAGDTVIIMRNPGAPVGTDSLLTTGSDAAPKNGKTEQINLKSLLESSNSTLNVSVYPGDIVKVARAGIVYVVGEVAKPGGFTLRNNENISVLQAVALAEGLTRTSAKSQARIIRTEQTTNRRIEIPVDLGKILSSKSADIMLQPKDIVFVPNSAGKTALYRSAQAALTTATGVAIYGRW